MAKELPYYKHEPSEWLEGEIQMCSDAAIVCFQNLCSGYWLKLGCISYAFALHKYCRKDASVLQELIDLGIVDLFEDQIRIKFLDRQLEEFNSVSEKRRQAANNRWSNANALQLESKSNAIREDNIREEKKKEELTSNDVSQVSDENPKKEPIEKIDFDGLLKFYNNLFTRKCRVVNDQVKKKYKARLKEGYTKEQIVEAMEKAKKVKSHIDSDFMYLTLEFFSRAETLDKYGTLPDKPIQKQTQEVKSPAHQTYIPIG